MPIRTSSASTWNEAATIWDLRPGDLVSAWPGAGSLGVFMRFYSFEDRGDVEWVGVTARQGRGKYYTIAMVDDRGMKRDYHVCEDQLKDLKFVIHNR